VSKTLFSVNVFLIVLLLSKTGLLDLPMSCKDLETLKQTFIKSRVCHRIFPDMRWLVLILMYLTVIAMYVPMYILIFKGYKAV